MQNTNTKALWIILLIFLLFGCGQAAQELVLDNDNRDKAVREMENSIYSKAQFIMTAHSVLTWINKEPANGASAWQRHFLFGAQAERADWTVEKRLCKSKLWQAVGFSDSKGAFVDFYVEQSYQYRFAKQYSTACLPALYDWYLDEDFCTKNAEIKAYRVIYPFRLAKKRYSNCRVSIESQIFKLEADLLLESSVGSFFFVRTSSFEGPGQLIHR